MENTDQNRRPGRRRNRRSSSVKVITSRCGEHILRGVPKQIIEKYQSLAHETNDATGKEMFLQHAEHYTRKLNNGSPVN